MQCMLQEKHSLKLKVVKESDELSERMFEHMMKNTKLEIKSTINVLIQINGEDQDISLVDLEMELLYLYLLPDFMFICKMLQSDWLDYGMWTIYTFRYIQSGPFIQFSIKVKT